MWIGLAVVALAAIAGLVARDPGTTVSDPTGVDGGSIGPSPALVALRADSDADVVLAWGEHAPPTDFADVPTSAPVSIDLALPVPVDDGVSRLPTRVLRAGQDPLVLDARVESASRSIVRLDLPAGWLTRGEYLIEVKTTELNPLPLRRFGLVVE